MPDKIIEMKRQPDGLLSATVTSVGSGDVSSCFGAGTENSFVTVKFFAESMDALIGGFKAAAKKRAGVLFD